MHRRARIVAIGMTWAGAWVGSGACAGRSALAAPSADDGVRIAANAMQSSYGIQLRAAGSVVRRGQWLYVIVPTGAVRTYQGTAPAWDLTVRAALSTCTTRAHWDVVSESRAARVAQLVGFTPDSSMLDTTTQVFRDTLRLDLGVPPGTDLRRSWVTFELAWPISGVIASYSLASDVTLGATTGEPSGAVPEQVCR